MTDFYDKNYLLFYQKTYDIDPTVFISPFVAQLARDARILDIGCGSGRDLIWLKNRGFYAVGFERSTGLANLARKHSGCEVIEGDFEQYDFSSLCFDAVYACGALVHLPHDQFEPTVQKIIQCLTGKEGYVFISVKCGAGQKKDKYGRLFYLWDEKSLNDIYSRLGFLILDINKSESARNSKDVWLGYVLKKSN